MESQGGMDACQLKMSAFETTLTPPHMLMDALTKLTEGTPQKI